jgi:hypothetical protein
VNYCSKTDCLPQETFHPLCVCALSPIVCARNPVHNRAISSFEPQARASSPLESKAPLFEQRAAIRYRVNLRVEFGWADSCGNPRKSEGLTKNLSPRGAYVMAVGCPPPGTKVQIKFELSPCGSGSGPLWLEAQGSILRTELASGVPENRGFAVQLWRARAQTR